MNAIELTGYEADQALSGESLRAQYRHRQLELALAGRIVESAKYAQLAAGCASLESQSMLVCC